jgi:hypothetical protein
MCLCVLSICAAVISIASAGWLSLSWSSAFAVFFGLQGTVFLASALERPIYDCPPKDLCSSIKWWITEVPKYSAPIRYHPLRYYVGLFFVAISFILSAIK